jgi:TPR repeat protein
MSVSDAGWRGAGRIADYGRARVNRRKGTGKKTMGRKFLLAGLLVGAGLGFSRPALADTKAGVDAWTRGDFPGAVKAWQAEAAKGDGDAIFNLGQAYRLGKGVPQDLTKAEALFGQAAAMGHLQAADNYGLLLFQRGDKAKALPYLRAAADRGDPRAEYLLGIAHFNGDMVPKDWVRAYALVTLAQQQGLQQATGALAQMDQYVPLDQRQQGVQLASELGSQADATRARQLTTVDLGAQVPGSAQPATQPIKGPTVASANDAADQARRGSPATAGADYARPAAPAPRPVAVHQGPPPGVTPPVPAPRPVVKPVPAPTPAAAPSSAGGTWRVQLGAFGVAGNADAMWAKVKGLPEIAGHPRLNVKAGAVTKLQAGGYSQTAAQSACAKLKAAGITCAAVPG